MRVNVDKEIVRIKSHGYYEGLEGREPCTSYEGVKGYIYAMAYWIGSKERGLQKK